MLTLDEEIQHFHEKAEELKNKGFDINTRFNTDTKAGRECYECAKDCEQVAEWLTKLKERREADRWNVIRSKEDLPKESGKYLVSGVWESGKEQVEDCEFNVEDGYFDACWNFNVIAWKPMPKPCGER